MSINKQIEKEIGEILDPLMRHKSAIINPVLIAQILKSKLDPGGQTPTKWDHLAILQARDVTRKYLAKHNDPVHRIEKEIDAQNDMFSDELQEFYPATQADENGGKTQVYKHRTNLNHDDAERIAERMNRAGNTLISHARKLRRYVWERMERVKRGNKT